MIKVYLVQETFNILRSVLEVFKLPLESHKLK